MARIIGSIPNFINGVSQQPAALRLPSQAQNQINCYSTVAKGLIRRPPTEHVCKITSGLPDSVFTHIINRDVSERYVVTYNPDDVTQKLRVYDFEGNEQTVSFPDGDSYLDCTTPSEDLVALTVADYTFIVNKTKVITKAAATSPARKYEALVSFGTIQPGSTVEVRVTQGATTYTATQAISDTDPSELETNWVCGQIVSALSSVLPGTFTCARTETGGSVMYLRDTAADFKVTVRDGSNGLGIKVIKDKVQYFEDLPRQGREGFRVEIAGDPVTGFGNYWVEFESETIPVWKESMAPATELRLDPNTMPLALINTGVGTFSLEELDWADRAVGDDDNNPFPSFVGETINDVFFTKSRLAFCAGEGVIMSEAGEFFNFFRTTVTTLVDGDPIDVASNHTKVSILRHAVSYQEQLLLFSDQTQFRLTQGDILSPQTVGIEPITEFESSILAKPAPVGNFVFFAVEKSDYASVREYFVADDSQRNDGREITGHIPEYLPTGITRLKGSSNEDAILAQSKNSAANELFIYKYFWSGNEKVQSSWSKWIFPDATAILGFEFIKSTLFLVVKRADGVFLERMELDSGAIDDSGTGYNYRIDRKVFSSDSNVSSSYNAGTDQTTFTFSDMTWKSVPKIIGCEGNTEYPPGFYVDIVGNPTTYDANTIVVSGDATGEDFAFGLPFESEYELSEIVPQTSSQQGGSVPITEGRLQLMWITFRYAETGYFTVTVIPERRDANIYEFNGRTLGSLENPLNDLPVDASGSFRVPVYSRSDRTRIIIKSSDPLPMRIISADWIGNLIQKFRRT